MIDLDTGCFLKLYYPEPDGARIVALTQGKHLCYTPLHELEFLNALQLKVFLKSATAAQVAAARALVESGLKTDVLIPPATAWKDSFGEAVKLAQVLALDWTRLTPRLQPGNRSW